MRVQVNFIDAKDLFYNVKKDERYIVGIGRGDYRYFRTKKTAKNYCSKLNTLFNSTIEVITQYYKNFLFQYVDLLPLVDKMGLTALQETKLNLENRLHDLKYTDKVEKVVRCLNSIFYAFIEACKEIVIELYKKRQYKALEGSFRALKVIIENEQKRFKKEIKVLKVDNQENKIKQLKAI